MTAPQTAGALRAESVSHTGAGLWGLASDATAHGGWQVSDQAVSKSHDKQL